MINSVDKKKGVCRYGCDTLPSGKSAVADRLSHNNLSRRTVGITDDVYTPLRSLKLATVQVVVAFHGRSSLCIRTDETDTRGISLCRERLFFTVGDAGGGLYKCTATIGSGRQQVTQFSRHYLSGGKHRLYIVRGRSGGFYAPGTCRAGTCGPIFKALFLDGFGAGKDIAFHPCAVVGHLGCGVGVYGRLEVAEVARVEGYPVTVEIVAFGRLVECPYIII